MESRRAPVSTGANARARSSMASARALHRPLGPGSEPRPQLREPVAQHLDPGSAHTVSSRVPSRRVSGASLASASRTALGTGRPARVAFSKMLSPSWAA